MKNIARSGSAHRDDGLPDTPMGRLFRETDWAATPLGPVDTWPQSLWIAVRICLNSRFPMFVWWGPSLVNIYNDAYMPITGTRHPRAFGAPAQETWSEIWDVVGVQADLVMRESASTWNERVKLVMQRNGFEEETFFTWSYSPIHDDEGNVGGVFCACSEETGRVIAERDRDHLMQEAQDTVLTLQRWFDNAPGFVALLRGPEFVFEMVNDAYYQLVGHREIKGLPAFEALPEVRDQGYEQILRRVYDLGEPFVGRAMRLVVQRERGGPTTETFIDLVYQPVRDSQGSVVGIFAQGHDVSEQVRAVQGLKDADRRKDEFLATLAHELRNPLAPIRQAVAIAKSGRAAEDRKAWALDVIERQAVHMSVLLDDLLDVSRITRERMELSLTRVGVAEVMNTALETARPLFERKRHRIELELPEPSMHVQADPIRLAQVLSNLLSNAAKYTDAGGTIRFGATHDEAQVIIRVRDNGVGLRRESQAVIFEMFSQVSDVLDRAEGGLGIGLALSRGLVTLHGGTIEVESEGLGMGSEFRVRLPAPAQQAPEEPQWQSPAFSPGRPRRVLIADDNRDAVESLATLLESFGHSVGMAHDGKGALRVAEESRPEIAILDIGMPGLNGYEVAAQMRSHSWGRDILLVALTGWGQKEDHQRSSAAGFDHHLTKPVDAQVLHRLISEPDLNGRNQSGA